MTRTIQAIALALTLAIPGLATAQTDGGPAAAVTALTTDGGVTATAGPSKSAAAEPAKGEAKADESKAEGEDLGTLGEEALALARAGKWFALLGVVMLIAVAAGRKLLFRQVEWFQTKTGGYVMAGIIAALTIGGLSIKLGFSIDVIVAGLTAAGLASGLHTATSDAAKGRAD